MKLNKILSLIVITLIIGIFSFWACQDAVDAAAGLNKAVICTPTAVITAPFAQDGIGEFCWETTSLGNNINSWNLDILEVNGTVYTNTYVASSTIAMVNNKYVIHYKSSVAWGHFEILGSGGATVAPTATTVTRTATRTSTTVTRTATATRTSTTVTRTATRTATTIAATRTATTVTRTATATTVTRTATATGTPAATATGATTPPSVNCSGYPIWNSFVVYNTQGQLVQYNCKLYSCNGYAYNLNPETNSYNEWTAWQFVGNCSNSDCPMGEGPFIGCGLWDKWTNGGYTVYNNIWGSGAGTQCLTAYNYSNFSVTANHPLTSGVKSYPNSEMMVGKTLSTLGSCTSNFNVTVPLSGGAWVSTYDVWCNGGSYEIMLWMNKMGAVGPIAGAWDDSGTPIVTVANVTVGGHTWNVYKGNIGFDVFSFLPTTDVKSGSVDIKAILNWIKAQGWFADVTLTKVQFGFEITANGSSQTFTCNSYSVSWN